MHSILARLGVIQTQVGFFPDINQKRQRDWGWMPMLENAPFWWGWLSGDLQTGSGASCFPSPVSALAPVESQWDRDTGVGCRMRSRTCDGTWDAGCRMQDVGLLFSCNLKPQHPPWSD